MSENTSVAIIATSGSTFSFTYTYNTQTSFNRWLEAGLFQPVSIGEYQNAPIGVAEGKEIPQFISHAIGFALQNGKAGEIISVSLASNAVKVKLKKDVAVGAILHEGDIDNNYKQQNTTHLKPTNKDWRQIISR